MATTLYKKGEQNYFNDPDSLYSEDRLCRRPRNRGTTEGNVYQLLPKSEMMTFYSSKMMTVQFPKLNDGLLLCMIIYPSCPWLTSYPLREYCETAHQIEPSPLTGFLHESRRLRPRSLAQHYPPNEQQPSRSKGYWITTCPSNPKESGRPRVMTRKHKMPLSLLVSSMNSTFQYRITLSRFFWELILTKASEPPRSAPNRCQFQSTSLLLLVFHPSARLTAVHWFSSNITM